jgi:hypothetical protein
MGLALAAGVVAVARIEYASGDVYPSYSSLRSDPDGAKVLYEALAGTGVETYRKYQPVAQAPERGATIFYLGVPALDFLLYDEEAIKRYETAAEAGNRVVLALDSGRRRRVPRIRRESPVESRWKVHVSDAPDEEAGWPQWFSRADEWKVISRDEGRPVVLEKEFGSGAIVLLTASRIFSNRAMVEDRQPALLLRAAGNSRRMVFDETHFGIEESGSVLGLAQRYRLQGLLWGLIVFSAIFVWRNAVGFPPDKREAEEEAVTGFDGRAGLVKLLQRSIAVDDVVGVCIREWRKTNPRGNELGAWQGDAVAQYAQIRRQIGGK